MRLVENAQDSGADRRAHRRITAADLEWLRTTRVKYGPEVRLVDVSTGGLAVETEHPLTPHSTVVFELIGATGAILVPARVLRSQVVSSHGITRYRSACVCRKPIDLSPYLSSCDVAPSADVKADSTSTSAPVRLASSWQKVVVRYRDGGIIRGFTSDFSDSRPQLHVSSDPTSGDPALIVPVNQLKALFFVRAFSGDPTYVEKKTFTDPPQGRTLEVTFEDGEALIGSTLSYRPDGHGFFVHPADRSANNIRVFVSAVAVRHVRFLTRRQAQALMASPHPPADRELHR